MKHDADQHNQQPGRQAQGVIASPNPTVKEAAPGTAPAAVEGAKVGASATTKQAPMKKSRKRKTRPRTD